jgi:RNA polymerase sigma factor (sigma-70 family)
VNPLPANSLLSAPPQLLAAEETDSAEKTAESRWFREELQPHEADLRGYLRARFPTIGDLDDLIQEAYIRLLRVRSSGRHEVNRAVLFVVARNVGLDLIRHERRVVMQSLGSFDATDVVDEKADNPAEHLSHEQELALVREAIAHLPPRCAEIVRLHRFEGLSYAAIAERLSLSERTVNAQLALGVVRCRRYLADCGVASARLHAT